MSYCIGGHAEKEKLLAEKKAADPKYTPELAGPSQYPNIFFKKPTKNQKGVLVSHSNKFIIIQHTPKDGRIDQRVPCGKKPKTSTLPWSLNSALLQNEDKKTLEEVVQKVILKIEKMPSLTLKLITLGLAYQCRCIKID